MYRSSPPLPGIFCPFHLLPSAHAPPKPDPEESFSMESYIDSSDSEFGRAEAGEAAGDEEGGERSPNPSEGTRGDHPKGTRSVARKRRSASQSAVDRYVLSYLLQSRSFHRLAFLKLFLIF